MVWDSAEVKFYTLPSPNATKYTISGQLTYKGSIIAAKIVPGNESIVPIIAVNTSPEDQTLLMTILPSGPSNVSLDVQYNSVRFVPILSPTKANLVVFVGQASDPQPKISASVLDVDDDLDVVGTTNLVSSDPLAHFSALVTSDQELRVVGVIGESDQLIFGNARLNSSDMFPRFYTQRFNLGGDFQNLDSRIECQMTYCFLATTGIQSYIAQLQYNPWTQIVGGSPLLSGSGISFLQKIGNLRNFQPLKIQYRVEEVQKGKGVYQHTAAVLYSRIGVGVSSSTGLAEIETENFIVAVYQPSPGQLASQLGSISSIVTSSDLGYKPYDTTAHNPSTVSINLLSSAKGATTSTLLISVKTAASSGLKDHNLGDGPKSVQAYKTSQFQMNIKNPKLLDLAKDSLTFNGYNNKASTVNFGGLFVNGGNSTAPPTSSSSAESGWLGSLLWGIFIFIILVAILALIIYYVVVHRNKAVGSGEDSYSVMSSSLDQTYHFEAGSDGRRTELGGAGGF